MIVPPVPDAGDEVRDPAVGLVPDLRAGRPLVGRRVLQVPVLVRLEGAGDVAREPRRDRVVRLRRFRLDVRRAEDDLGAVGPQQGLLLGRLLVGHDEDAAVALERRRDRQAVAGVARRRLDDRAARLEQAGALGRLDHRQADPVLDRAARVERLELGEDERLVLEAAEVAGDAGQPDERRVADEIEDRFGVPHPGRISGRGQSACSSGPGPRSSQVSRAAEAARPVGRIDRQGIQLLDDRTEPRGERLGQATGQGQLGPRCPAPGARRPTPARAGPRT